MRIVGGSERIAVPYRFFIVRRLLQLVLQCGIRPYWTDFQGHILYRMPFFLPVTAERIVLLGSLKEHG